ncbi:GIY-YIG nuclease family protein [Curtobacterium sp. C2H10]|uniref:GIY-YIG nuclease family protein n=1 Tax=Curtobacterium sp. C2H10 TaxID=2736664 RepID=UPI0021C1062D|nr:GIY-YIG nuclease family protein [Curtobacterium sp. C2H10]MCT9620959.1 GIY-YIG nuclease family protein [Curtobacterium sp. C2H10]
MAAQNAIDPGVQQQVANELGLYVYMLVDPETGVPFYVGKGQSERFASHGREALLTASTEAPSSKIAMINAIRERGAEPEIWIVRYGMRSEVEYTSVEAACIDLLRSMPVLAQAAGTVRLPGRQAAQLTNARRESAKGHGIMRFQDLLDEMSAPPLETETPLLIVTLGAWKNSRERALDGSEVDGYGYKADWLPRSERENNAQEIGHSASKWFKFSEATVERHGIEYAVAAHRGVTRALLRIVPGSWQHQGSGSDRRSGFRFEVVRDGALFEETVGAYGHRLPEKKRGEQSTFRYWPYAR